MRILYFYQYFGTTRGAWSTRSYEFARRWVRSGDSVTVVTTVYDKSDLRASGFLDRVEVEGIDVRVINVGLSNKHGKAVRLLTFFAYALVASMYALLTRADVILASSGPITVGVPALVARLIRRRPFVFEVRDLWPEGAIQLGILRNPLAIRAARALERLCYRWASTVVVLSEGMAEWLRKAGVQDLEIIPNAADNALFAPGPGARRDGGAGGRHTAIYTGTLGLIDDCMQIIRAAEVLQDRGVDDIEVVLIGDGREATAIRSYVAEHEVGNVRLTGLLPKEEVAERLRHADCALMTVRPVPFLDTASPNKLFDALAAGVPMIQTTQGWIRELFEREDCGLTTPPNDPEAMADAIERLVRDGETRRRLSGNALRLARGPFDRDRLASRMRGVLARAMANGR